jgi:hypothetical protein
MPSYDDSQIWNDVRVTADGGTVQTASDATSQAAYFKRTLAKSGLWIGDASGIGGATPDEEASNAAQWHLANYKDPALRFKSVTVAGASGDSVWTQMLSREISNRITVVRRPPGGGAAISAEVFIEAVEHRIGGNIIDWRTTWQLSPASSLTYLTLDHATLGVIDANRLAY